MFEGANPRQSTCFKCIDTIGWVQEHFHPNLLLWFLPGHSYLYISEIRCFIIYCFSKLLKPYTQNCSFMFLITLKLIDYKKKYFRSVLFNPLK